MVAVGTTVTGTIVTGTTVTGTTAMTTVTGAAVDSLGSTALIFLISTVTFSTTGTGLAAGAND
jgi:hypothetical protein